MCGRYASSLAPDAIARLFHTVNPIPNAPPSWNIAPTQSALVVCRDPASGARQLVTMRWGLVPPWMQDPRRAQINARAETVATTPFFRSAFAARRCLVPAVAFYEWAKGPGAKQPYAVARRDAQPLAFAGVWERARSGNGATAASETGFAIITTPANATLSPIHGRMPAILDATLWPLWLGETPADARTLLRPAPDDLLHAWPVGRQVNSPAHDGPELLAPVGKTESLL